MKDVLLLRCRANPTSAKVYLEVVQPKGTLPFSASGGSSRSFESSMFQVMSFIVKGFGSARRLCQIRRCAETAAVLVHWRAARATPVPRGILE